MRSCRTGKPLFGTLISLVYDGTPILGIIDQPIIKVRGTRRAGNHIPAGLHVVRNELCSRQHITARLLLERQPFTFWPACRLLRHHL